MRRWSRLSGLALGALMAASPALARTNHALLVGVTEYPNLPPKAALVGPANDVGLIRDYLLTAAPVPFEAGDVTVLADGIDGATPPTLAAIRAGLARLAKVAEDGDFVFIHLGGHGAQQPALDPSTETDGKDEIFLPRDTGLWTDRSKGVPNALVDDEIGAALEAIRDRGAFVWVVFDACHSGTATRAVPTDDVAERRLDPALLNVPDDDVPVTRGAGGGEELRENALGLGAGDGQAGQRGGMVAFFAAQTVETTPELKLPRGAPDARQHGLFTYTLFSQLGANPAMSYRQLAQSVLQDYAAKGLVRPTPLFEGALDAPVFGIAGEDAIVQWRIETKGEKLSIPAGRLHRVDVGTRLAVLPSPASGLNDALGYVEVVAAQNLRSSLSPVAHAGLPAPETVPANAYARPVELAIDFTLAVALADEAGASAGDAGRLNAALRAVAEEGGKPVNIELVETGASADLRLAVLSEAEAERLAPPGSEARSVDGEPLGWLLPATGEISLERGHRPPSVTLGDDDALKEELGDALVRIYRATSLARLSAASDYRASEVQVSFRIRRSDSGRWDDVEAGVVPVVHPGDEIHGLARNRTRRPVDVNFLFVGSDHSIGFMGNERLHPESELSIPIAGLTDDSFGIERVIAVLTEAQPQSPVEDLSFLAQIGVRQATRAAGVPEGIRGLLQDIGLASVIRGGMRLGEGRAAKGAVLIVPMETRPK
jgi:hypothetical protein